VNELASYENHYNAMLNGCMIAVESQFFENNLVLEFNRVVDVLENKKVANYVRQVMT
jgi:hypothetical protein